MDKKVIEAIAGDMSALLQTAIKNEGLSSLLSGQGAQVILTQHANPVVEMLVGDFREYEKTGQLSLKDNRPAIDALREWALTNNLPTDNSSLYFMYRTMIEKKQSFLSLLLTLEKEINHNFENKWSGRLTDSVVSRLEQLIN